MARQMKDSGIEWIGEIPRDWHVMKMNMICAVITDYVASGSFADLAANVTYLDEPDYAMLIRTADVSGKGHVSKPVYINQHAYDFLSNSNLFGGEIILPNIGGVGEAYLVPKLYEHMSLAPNAIMIKTKYCDKFYYYYFNSDAGSKPIISISQSTAQAKFNKTDFKQIRAAVPPLEEQKAIADFLDSRCAEIDAVIEHTKATIEEYKKLKKAVITEAVTKGVRGARKMKDSGIEWIGEIPEEWQTCKIKDIFQVVSGATPKSEQPEYWDGDIVWVTPADYKTNDKFVSSGKRTLTQEGYNSCGTTLVPTGSIIFSKRAPIGSVAIAQVPLCTNQGCLSCIRKGDADTNFFYYVMSIYTEIFELYGSGTTFKELSFDNFVSFAMPNPDVAEQHCIVAYLDEKCAALDTLIAKKTALLTELETYKKSLIYEYVTGKKEVV